MWYNHYRGRTAGRILGVIELYCGLNVVNDIRVGNGKIEYRDKVWTFEWEGESDNPLIAFKGQKDYEKVQKIFRPFIEDADEMLLIRNSNLLYVIQEVKAGNGSAMELMKKYMYGWSEEKCQKYLDHVVLCTQF